MILENIHGGRPSQKFVMRNPLLLLFVLLWFATSVSAQTYGPSGATGGGQPIDNYQPTLAIRYMICTSGLFPSREGGSTSSTLSTPLVGEIRPIAFGTSLPAGFAECDGTTLPISGNTALFSVLGTYYGGDGQTTFCLPDLRGRVPVGVGYTGVSALDIGQSFGVSSNTLTTANLPAHSHSLTNGYCGQNGLNQSFDNFQPSLAIYFSITGDGEIMMFGGNFAPNGTLPCDGRLLNINDYPDLYNALGTSYGGDGLTTFALPNFAGRTPIEVGQGAGLTSYTLGDIVGTESITLTTSQIPAHTHTTSIGLTGSTGQGNSFDNRQPCVPVTWYLCLSGSGTSGAPRTGEMRVVAGGSNPLSNNWATATGLVLPINTYSSLYNLLGVTYGGNGVSTFKLPDLRGRIAADIGQAPGLRSLVLGETAGQETTSITTSQMAAHTHPLAIAPIITSYPADIVTNSSAALCAALLNFSTTAIGDPAPQVYYTLNGNYLGGSPFILPIGSNVVNVTAQNGVGTNATRSFKVIVLDTDPPAITAPPITVTSDGGYCPKVVNFSPTITDCALSNSYSIPPSGSAFPVGTNFVTTYAIDNSGNTNSRTFTVTVLPGPAAKLNVAQVGTNVVFSWSNVFSCYIVEAANTLSAVPTNWTAVSGIPTLNAGNYYLTNGATATNRFYRLRY